MQFVQRLPIGSARLPAIGVVDRFFRSLVGRLDADRGAPLARQGGCGDQSGALDAAGIEIPFPYRTLTFKQPLGVRLLGDRSSPP
jgi:hypothetical protein